MTQDEITQFLTRTSIGTVLRVVYTDKSGGVCQHEARVRSRSFSGSEVDNVTFEEGAFIYRRAADYPPLPGPVVWRYGKNPIVEVRAI